MRDILVGMLQDAPDFQVVGTAQDGLEAVQLASRLRPDVITMDIRMPRLNGLEATRRIMSVCPTPIVVVSNNIYAADLNIAFSAITAGALTVVEKPHGLDPVSYNSVRDELISAVRLMADVQVVTLLPDHPQAPSALQRLQAKALDLASNIDLIAIAASTGGPGVLNQILKALPGDFSIPIVVVQHITRGFGQGFAHWLDSLTPLHVSIARQGEHVEPGHVLIAPDDMHVTVTPGGVIQIDRTAPLNGQRPSATRLFHSVAQTYRERAMGIILTGMGADGVEGLAEMSHAGAHIIAQNEESCVVFGMPKEAIEQGIVSQVLSPEAISDALIRLDQGCRLRQVAVQSV
jgi:two-component system chemotaxis response regulator CheB